MTEKNGSNDIAEILRLLRQSVDADRAEPEKDKKDEPAAESDGLADEPEQNLQELVEEMKNFEEEAEPFEETAEDEDSDPWYDDMPEDEEIKDDAPDIEIASAEERVEEDDEEDPWFQNMQNMSDPGIEELAEEPEENESFEDIPEYISEEELEEGSAVLEDDIELSEESELQEEDAESVFIFDDFARTEVSEESDTFETEKELEEEIAEEPEEDIEQAEEASDGTDVFEMPYDDPYEYGEDLEDADETVEDDESYESDGDESYAEDLAEDENIDRELSEINGLEDSEDNDERLDETDISFLQNMGYTSFSVAESAVKNDDSQKLTKEPLGDIAYDHDGEEYVIKKQSDEIKIDYAEQKKNTLIRLALAGVAALLLLVYETLAFSGVTLPWLFNQHEFPLSHSMISLQLLVIAAAMSLNLISKGISDAFCLRSTPYSVGSILILLNVVYTVVIAVVNPENYMLFNFGGALAAVLAIVYEYVMLLSEEKAFYAVSCESTVKYAFSEDDNSEKPFGDEPTLRAYSTDFNKNFFAQMGKRASEYNYIGILIPAIVAAGLIIFALFWIITGNVTSSVNTGMLVINFALPLGVMGAYALPMFLALAALKKDRGAVIGHSSVDRYSKTRFVTFDETDIFPSIKTTYIDLKPSGNQQISKVLHKTSMLFSAIGGPLRRMVETAGEGDTNGSVEIIGIFDDGISATVDSSPMLVGSARFLEINSVDVNAPTDYRDSDGSNEILYVAIDGKLAARYYIKYVPDPDFVEAVNLLGAKGISVGIRTRNPGVNSRIIEKRCPEMLYKVYTIKSLSDDEKDLTSHQNTTDSGIIAHGKAANLVHPLIISLSLKKYYKADTYIRCASAVLGALIVIVFAAMGRVSELGSLAAGLHQLIWFIPSAVAAWFISVKKKKQ